MQQLWPVVVHPAHLAFSGAEGPGGGRPAPAPAVGRRRSLARTAARRVGRSGDATSPSSSAAARAAEPPRVLPLRAAAPPAVAFAQAHRSVHVSGSSRYMTVNSPLQLWRAAERVVMARWRPYERVTPCALHKHVPLEADGAAVPRLPARPLLPPAEGAACADPAGRPREPCCPDPVCLLLPGRRPAPTWSSSLSLSTAAPRRLR